MRFGACLKQGQKQKRRSLKTMFDDLHIENTTSSFESIYLVQIKKASNLAVRRKLGIYPLFIDVVLSLVKYWVQLNDAKIELTICF